MMMTARINRFGLDNSSSQGVRDRLTIGIVAIKLGIVAIKRSVIIRRHRIMLSSFRR
jgi:hypothetical protein